MTVIKQYPCDPCNVIFSKISDFIVHSKAMKHPIKCDLCQEEKFFETSLALNRHTTAEHKLKRKRCGSCGVFYSELFLYYHHTMEDCAKESEMGKEAEPRAPKIAKVQEQKVTVEANTKAEMKVQDVPEVTVDLINFAQTQNKHTKETEDSEALTAVLTSSVMPYPESDNEQQADMKQKENQDTEPKDKGLMEQEVSTQSLETLKGTESSMEDTVEQKENKEIEPISKGTEESRTELLRAQEQIHEDAEPSAHEHGSGDGDLHCQEEDSDDDDDKAKDFEASESLQGSSGEDSDDAPQAPQPRTRRHAWQHAPPAHIAYPEVFEPHVLPYEPLQAVYTPEDLRKVHEPAKLQAPITPSLTPYGLFIMNLHKYLITVNAHPEYLLLENYAPPEAGQRWLSQECFMNCLSQLFYSIPALRGRLSEHPAVGEIFRRLIPSARKWRTMLPERYFVGQHDLHTVFEEMIKDFLTRQIDISPIQCRTTNVRKCPCQGSRPTTLQAHTSLTITNGSFMSAFESLYASESRICAACGGQWLKGKKVEPLGDFHVIQIQYRTGRKDTVVVDTVTLNDEEEGITVVQNVAKPSGAQRSQKKFITDLNFHSQIPMFGFLWQIRSIGIRQPDIYASDKMSSGHFTTFVKVGDQFVYINDDRIENMDAKKFEDFDVKMIVFEKVRVL